MQTKICSKCKIEKELSEFNKNYRCKYGVRSACKMCDSELYKKYYKNNKEQVTEKKKQYRQENKEKIAKYRQTNKKNINEIHKQYRQENKEKIAKYKQQYYQTPQGKAVAKSYIHNRRARKINGGGKHTAKQILELFELQSGKCVYCKTKLYKTRKNKYHIDHVVPLSKDGSNDISNIQLLCPTCNGR